MQDLRIFIRERTYDIENRGKGGSDETGSGFCLVLCGDRHDTGADTAQHIRRGVVYHIVCAGGI